MKEKTGLYNKIGGLRRRVFAVIDINNRTSSASRFYDFFSIAVLILNIAAVGITTISGLDPTVLRVFTIIDGVTVAFFALDCFLRVWVAKYQHPNLTPGRAVKKYLLSFDGIIDLLSFVPYYLPIFFPAGMAVFRFFRVVRFLRIFRINGYYDSFTVITDVLKSKKSQILSSIFIILVLMMASSLCMYSLEHDAQPEVFTSAFSGIWWSASALLTIGYGDIYPITMLGKIFGTVISFLGVGLVAIPTGIISAGFVEQYSRIKRMADYGEEAALNFVKIVLSSKDDWVGKEIKDLHIPTGAIISVIIRGHKTIIPRGNVVLQADDTIVLGAESFSSDLHIELKEITIAEHNPWNGLRIRDLDISRRTIIVMIKRGKRSLVPKGDMIILEGDQLLIYTELPVKDITGRVVL